MAARVDRLIADRDERGPNASARRQRITAAVRDGRRALLTRRTSRAAVQDAEARVGAALVRITAEGLPLKAAIDAVGVSKTVGRRLASASAETTRRLSPASPTDTTSLHAACVPGGHPEIGATATGDTSVKGNP